MYTLFSLNFAMGNIKKNLMLAKLAHDFLQNLQSSQVKRTSKDVINEMNLLFES